MILELKTNELVDIIKSAVSEAVATALQGSTNGENSTKKEVEYLTRKQAAKKLKISLATLSTYQKEGKISFNRLGRKVLFTEEDIQAALKQINITKKKTTIISSKN